MSQQGGFGESEFGGTMPPTGFPECFTNSFRGMLLGMLLGDVRNPGEHPLWSGPASQQVCWMLDALIRHELQLRSDQRITESVVDAAGDSAVETAVQTVREAPIEQLRTGLLRWGARNRDWPHSELLDGWVSRVPALAEHREPTDAEDSALSDLEDGRFLAAGHDRGVTALLRSLPISASSLNACPDLMARWCAGSAGLTHGHPEAWSTAALLGVITGGHLTAVYRDGPWVRLDIASAVRWFVRDLPNHPLLDRLTPALDDTTDWDPDRLADISGDGSCGAVLAGAVYLFRHSRDLPIGEVRRLAESAGDPTGVSALTGALMGLEQGTGWLDVAELTRHELSWTLDTLARDYCLTLWTPPAYHGERDVLEEMPQRYPVRSDQPPTPGA